MKHEAQDRNIGKGWICMSSSPSFTRSLVPHGSRLMIQSVCVRCGASRLVSKHDGSLENWEGGHRCQPSIRKKGPASAGKSAPPNFKVIAGRRNR